MRSGLVSGPWRRRSHATRWWPGLASAAARSTACRRRPERLTGTLSPRGTLRPRGPHRPWTVRRPGGPGRSRGSCGARRASVAGDVDQPARRIHGRRVQHPSPLTARPRRGRRAVPVTSGLMASRAPGPPGPGERGNQQRNQADRETRHAQGHTQAGDMITRAPAEQVGGRARHHENPARHDHDGADHRQGNDKPHPSGRGGIRAHRSTIASRFAPRKPYRQVHPLRLALGAGRRRPSGWLWPASRVTPAIRLRA
jgi:hypothetical protein